MIRVDSCLFGALGTPPDHANCRNARAEHKIEGPGQGSKSSENHHLYGYPANQRQADRDRGKGGDRLPADGDRRGQQWRNAHEHEQDDPGYQVGAEWRPSQGPGRHPEQVAVRRQKEDPSSEERADAEEDLQHDGKASDRWERA